MPGAKLLIIDGSSLVYRAFFALPLLQTTQGRYTNAVYGFTNMLLRLLQEENPLYAAVAFDRAAPTFRHVEYAEYKAKREKTPAELSEQMPVIREILAAMQIPVIEMDGYEADDILGTFARQASELGINPVIVTGDADAFQLVDLPAEIIYSRRGITQVDRYTGEKLREAYGLSGRQFIDFKGLKGDASDNIPGVPGIGDKTARKLLGQYGSLEGIYQHIDEIPGKLRELLLCYREQAYRSRHLATIVTEAPVSFKPEDYVLTSPDYARLREIFETMEFKSLLARLPEEEGPAVVPEVAEDYATVETEADWERLAEILEQAGEIAVVKASPVSEEPALAIAVGSVGTFYVPAFFTKSNGRARSAVLSPTLKTITYDAKAWFSAIHAAFGQEPGELVFDVTLAAYLINPLQSGYPAERLVMEYLDCRMPEAPGKNEFDTQAYRAYYCTAARLLFGLSAAVQEKLRELDLGRLYERLELPLTRVLSRMEREGVAVDTVELDRLKEELTSRIAALEIEIYDLAGTEFNLNSPKQLAFILFEKLRLPALKKTKTGYSTDAEVLEELAGRHEIVAKILEYRMLVKLLGTYLEGMKKLVNQATGRIHTTYNQTVTATGRLSSAEPNLQNIPIRVEEGRRIRKLFVPGSPDRVLLSADYSQIELRILAHLSGDSVLINSFCKEEDIHRRTAAEVFSVDPCMVTREMRDRAKAVNFGIIYGISDYGLSRQLGITRQEAKLYIERYLERYPRVRDYFQNVTSEAHRLGYVVTLMNRRRYLPDINSKNFVKRSFAERTAMNTPIQGSAADIIKLAMLNLDNVLSCYGGRANMILQVHDELVIELEQNLLDDVARVVRRVMEEAVVLAVPLTVDLKAGANWAEMTELNYDRM